MAGVGHVKVPNSGEKYAIRDLTHFFKYVRPQDAEEQRRAAADGQALAAEMESALSGARQVRLKIVNYFSQDLNLEQTIPSVL